MTNVVYNFCNNSNTHLVSSLPSLQHVTPAPASNDDANVSEIRHTHISDGHSILIVDIHTGELVRILRPFNKDHRITKAQLNDPVAQALVDGSLKAKTRRAKRTVINPHGNELMTYKLNDEHRFFMLLKAIAVADKSLNTDAGKLNFNFRDLGRILCMDEFSSEHLFSSDRGNEYTMSAYRKTVNKFVSVSREAWRGRSLTPDYATDGAYTSDTVAGDDA